MQHGRDMRRKKIAPPQDHLDARLAMAFVASFAMLALAAKQAAVAADDKVVRESANDLVASLKRQHGRKIRARALRRRDAWRKADVANLLALPGDTREATAREIGQGLASDKRGRGVVPAPEGFEDALRDGLSAMLRTADPTTSYEERCRLHAKASPWHARLIEAAYRGELARLRLTTKIDKSPHLPLSEIAEDGVAAVVCITRPQVHRLCQQVRDDLKRTQRRAARRPGHGVEADPPMTAAELKRHLRQFT